MACALALAATGCSSGTPVASGAGQNAATTTSKTTTLAGPPAVTKVLVFIEENHSLDQMKLDMPYAFELAQKFGYATNYSAIRHPSLPNYIAIAGGQTYGISDDLSPDHNPVGGTSVFGQAVALGKTAGLYADSMPESCRASDAGSGSSTGDGYAVKHNPWTYFSTERGMCQQLDVPLDELDAAISDGTLPNVGMVIPNLCNDAHNCPLGTADDWFKGWMTKIFEGPDWSSGHLAVVLTADEDDTHSQNKVLTVVIHPSQKAHVVTTALTHYSLTRLYEEVAGAPFLFNARSAPSMSTAFALPLK